MDRKNLSIFERQIMSVRNLVEVVCLTPLLGATWYLVKNESLTRLWVHPFMGHPAS